MAAAAPYWEYGDCLGFRVSYHGAVNDVTDEES
jgi:hypothetical protein